ncbi:UNVERIFIED_CONTAM: hypothetical protein FKN15_052210 [Acipenser sinensis]
MAFVFAQGWRDESAVISRTGVLKAVRLLYSSANGPSGLFAYKGTQQAHKLNIMAFVFAQGWRDESAVISRTGVLKAVRLLYSSANGPSGLFAYRNLKRMNKASF